MADDEFLAADHVRYLRYSNEISDIDFHGDLDRVINLDTEVAHRALDLGVPEQKLDSSKISSPPIDQCRLGASQRVRAELRRIEPDACHPLLHQSRVLTSGYPTRTVVDPTGEQKLTRLSTGQLQVFVDRLAGLVRQFETHWPAGLLLTDGCAIHRITTRRHVIDANSDYVTAAQFAVDGKIEEREIALALSHLQFIPD